MLVVVLVSLLVVLAVVATFAMLVVGLEGHLAARMPRLAHRARAGALLLNGDLDELQAMSPLPASGPRRAQRTTLTSRVSSMLHALLRRAGAAEGQPSH